MPNFRWHDVKVSIPCRTVGFSVTEDVSFSGGESMENKQLRNTHSRL